ncbi:MAG: chemotaxis protein [Spirochaetes bacterium]|nr:chemotaxis protein [Spirochaetota bacterium]MBN2771045.1 chemotaxis protein [Spirochaetota bacterium]
MKKQFGNSNIDQYENEVDIFANVMRRNNVRILKAFVSIVLMANIATVAIKISGASSSYLTYKHIIVELALISLTLTVSYIVSKKNKNALVASYLFITGIVLSVWIFLYVIYGASELFAVHYVALALSIFYFDKKIIIYTLFLILLSQTTLFLLRPGLVPTGPSSNLIIRYLIYLWTGIGAAVGSGSTKELLGLAVSKHSEAQKNVSKMRTLARALADSVGVLRNHVSDQEGVTLEMETISQSQASSLTQISAVLEELAANSESINNISKSLFSDINQTVGSVEQFKEINDSVIENSDDIIKTLEEISSYSEKNSLHIKMTKQKSEILKTKSDEMSGFVQVINDIADQVTLLSLNASIEAARAGESGKGFAVVADEISKLAEATTNNAKEINNIIYENQKQIDESTTLIDESSVMTVKLNEAILKITGSFHDAGKRMRIIGDKIRAIRQINSNIYETSSSIDHSIQQQESGISESSETISNISINAQKIVSISNAIRVANNTLNDMSSQMDMLANSMLSADD